MSVNRLRLLAAAMWPVARRQRWWPTALATLGALGLLGTGDATTGTSQMILRLRIGAVLIGASAAFLLDDFAAESLAASPSTLRFRLALRVAVTMPVLVGAWTVLVWMGRSRSSSPEGSAALGGLGLEFWAMVAVALAGTALAQRFSPGPDGVTGACALLVLVAAAQALPPDWTLFVPAAQDPAWGPSHRRWSLILGTALAGLVVATRDPGSRRLLCRSADRASPVPLPGPYRRLRPH
jgi:hypothetical protein